jgi:hypothetical protein
VVPVFEERRFIVIRCWHVYRLVDRSIPVKRMSNPNTSPISNPIRIRLMKMPNTNPRTMAKMKAISLLRMLGFFWLVILF